MGKESNRPYARDGKPYVRDAGWAGRGPLGEAALSAAMVMLALAAGFAVGFLVWAVLSLANGLVALLWDALGKRGGEGFATLWFPLVVCTLGGLVIGVWTHFPQGARLRRLKRSWLRLRRRVLIAWKEREGRSSVFCCLSCSAVPSVPRRA